MKCHVITHSSMGDNGFHNFAVSRWPVCANKMEMGVVVVELTQSSDRRNQVVMCFVGGNPADEEYLSSSLIVF
jgi:hypothetical protein